MKRLYTFFKLACVFLLSYGYTNNLNAQCTNGVQLDGVDEYLHTPFNNYNFSNYTMECWVNVPNYTANVHYISLYQNAYLVLGGGWGGEFPTWADGLNPISTSTSPGLSINTWHHIAMVYDGTNQITYVNGVQASSTPTTGTVTQNTTTFNQGLVIGARYTQSTQYVNGMIRDVRIWNVARSQVDIQNNMNASLTGNEAGLVAYYTFNDGVGSSTAADHTGNGNTLTLYNMELGSDWLVSGPTATGTDIITTCDSLSWIDGNTYYANNTTATHTIVNGAANGCDSIVTLNLTLNSSVSNSVAVNVCHNTSYTYADGTISNNITANESHTSVLTGAASNTCDSIVTENLTVLAPLTGSVTNTICNNDSIVVNGTTYNAANPSGTEVFTNVGPNNCDSTVTINLTVLAPLTGSVTNTICNNGSVVVNGTTYNASNPSGTEVFSNVGPNNCDSTVTINLNVLPAIDVTVTNASPSLTSNENGATYQWLDCDNNFSIIAGATSQTFNASANGNYAVEVTVGNCVDTSACESVNNVGINKNDLFNGVSIFPNPTNNIINITLNNIDKTNLTVYTIDGKVVYQNNNITEKQVAIDLSNNSKGIYFLKVEAKNQNKVYKIIKE